MQVRLELIKALTYLRRTQYELRIIFKIKKKKVVHHAHASASCPRHFFYPSLIATQKEVKYGLKKMRRNSLYVPDTVTVFTVLYL